MLCDDWSSPFHVARFTYPTRTGRVKPLCLNLERRLKGKQYFVHKMAALPRADADRCLPVPRFQKSPTFLGTSNSNHKMRLSSANGVVDSAGYFLPTIVKRALEAHSVADMHPPKRRNITASLLFVDVSGFTALTEKLSKLENGAELMVTALNDYFTALLDIVKGNGGDTMKFSGELFIPIPHFFFR
jgi:class 3 adenylate cyclase